MLCKKFLPTISFDLPGILEPCILLPSHLQVPSPCRPSSSARGGSAALGNVSLNTSSVSGDLQLDVEADDLSVLILTEPEYVGSGNNLYKRRLAKLVTSKTTSAVHSVVIVARSARTPPQGTY